MLKFDVIDPVQIRECIAAVPLIADLANKGHEGELPAVLRFVAIGFHMGDDTKILRRPFRADGRWHGWHIVGVEFPSGLKASAIQEDPKQVEALELALHDHPIIKEERERREAWKVTLAERVSP